MRLPPFQQFLDAHRDAVYRFLVAAVGPHEADDCFQETFLAALRAYPQLRDAENLRGWVLTIAHNKAMDSHRGRARRATPVSSMPERPSDPPAERDPALWEAVRRLPAKQRAAIVLRYASDLTYRDVARIAGGSEEAARRNAADGLAKLRKEWAR